MCIRDRIDEVHGLNAHMMISIWSSFGPKTKPFKELEKEGLLMDMACLLYTSRCV